MGWIYICRPLQGETPREFLRKQFTPIEILDDATVGWGEYYAAARHPKDPDMVFAIVCMFKQSRNDFGYKDMDETVGPYQIRCPKRILDRLTPTTYPYAITWRENCRAYHAKPKPKKGDQVVFKHPIKFNNGETRDTFFYDKGNRFSGYRISGWKEREYTING